MEEKTSLRDWAISETNERHQGAAVLTTDPVYHPLWILVKRCIFNNREKAAFTEAEIYEMIETYCKQEYFSKNFPDGKPRVIHEDALKPITEAVPLRYLELLLVTETIGGQPHFYMSLYPFVKKEITQLGAPTAGFQETLATVGLTCREKTAALLQIVDNMPICSKALKKFTAKIFLAKKSFVVRKSASNFDNLRLALLQFSVQLTKTKDLSENLKSWQTLLKREMALG